jgi:hypothetical protein
MNGALETGRRMNGAILSYSAEPVPKAAVAFADTSRCCNELRNMPCRVVDIQEERQHVTCKATLCVVLWTEV